MSATQHSTSVTQSAFVAAALDPAAPVPDGIVGADGAPTTKRFNVYRNNIVVGLKEALAAGFPATEALVGKEFFDAMAGIFVRQSPPGSPMMPGYGAGFATFIEGFEPAASLPYLADVARLEYAQRAAYHAADAQAISAEALTDPLTFTRRATLAPAVRVVSSPYPIAQIHAAASGGPKPTAGGEDVLVTRPAFDPIMTAFPNGTAAVVNALFDGVALGAALDLAPPSLDVTAFFAALLSGGAITSLEDL